MTFQKYVYAEDGNLYDVLCCVLYFVAIQIYTHTISHVLSFKSAKNGREDCIKPINGISIQSVSQPASSEAIKNEDRNRMLQSCTYLF